MLEEKFLSDILAHDYEGLMLFDASLPTKEEIKNTAVIIRYNKVLNKWETQFSKRYSTKEMTDYINEHFGGWQLVLLTSRMATRSDNYLIDLFLNQNYESIVVRPYKTKVTIKGKRTRAPQKKCPVKVDFRKML